MYVCREEGVEFAQIGVRAIVFSQRLMFLERCKVKVANSKQTYMDGVFFGKMRPKSLPKIDNVPLF